eukprot:2854222-Rhodomonas_salina.1
MFTAVIRLVPQDRRAHESLGIGQRRSEQTRARCEETRAKRRVRCEETRAVRRDAKRCEERWWGKNAWCAVCAVVVAWLTT